MPKTPLPTGEEILARAGELELLGPDGSLAPASRQKVAALLFKERQTPHKAPQPELRSRQTFPAEGGVIRIDVVFIPNQKEDPNAHQQGS